jgi:hypothetical protein
LIAGEVANPRPEPKDAKNRTSFAAAIKAQFRQLAEAMTPRVPTPSRQRQRTEDEGRAAFGIAARNIMRRAVRLPAETYAAATAYLSDTLDWLNLWQEQPLHDDPAADKTAAQGQYLYPHL